MFAIAFDLVVADAAEHHPRGVTAAYTDIGITLKGTPENSPADQRRRYFPANSENPQMACF